MNKDIRMSDLQKEILRKKEEQDVCILAHSYQSHDILEIADFCGDSFQLSQQAAKMKNRTFLVCGVRFMAETVKLLSPKKRVILAAPDAGCPMAEQLTKEDVIALREKHPDHTVVSYINTTAAIKTVTDVCVTSASAVQIVRKIENDRIIFIPDCNLGAYVAEQIPEKSFVFVNGGCPVHTMMTKKDVCVAKEKHPNALFLVHPECRSEVVKEADFVGSTSAIMRFAEESDRKEFIIGTENSIAAHLQYRCPDKQFYLLSKNLICADMKATTLSDVYRCLCDQGGEDIVLDDETLRDARHCIDEMIRLG